MIILMQFLLHLCVIFKLDGPSFIHFQYMKEQLGLYSLTQQLCPTEESL